MAANVGALNYPYIRVRSVDWLKRTLLIFPHVVRMTPCRDAPADDPEIATFTEYGSRLRPLLRAAELDSPHVHEAQHQLIEDLRGRLEVEGPAFRERYGRDVAGAPDASSIKGNRTIWERRLAPDASFQIHEYKLYDELSGFLVNNHLAWRPDRSYAHGADYLEMHPRLGEAVMATLAVACAENEGLQVVTEFPNLHGKLIGVPREKILTSCLDGMKPSGQTSGQQIAEFLVYRHCNVDMLSAENLLELKDERAALADFRSKLEEFAKALPPTIFSEKHREEHLGDVLRDMFHEWERDQANMGAIGRRFFGDGLIPEAGKIIDKLIEAAMKPETVAHGVTAGGVIAGLTGHVLTGIGAGFAIAVVSRGFESWSSARSGAKKSPLRYLTKLQDLGVSFSVSR
jgi:hypothetical protein